MLLNSSGMAEEKFSPEESLRLIQQMIEKTRRGFSDRSHYFLLWGWAALLGCIGQFVLKAVYNYPYHYQVWWITIVCAVVTAFLLKNESTQVKAKTYVRENLEYLWTGLAVTYVVLCLIFVRLGWQMCFPFFTMLYGAGAFVSGRIIQFTPFVWGGVIAWMFAAMSVWVGMDYQMLFAAGALLTGYTIPGHLLRLKYHHA